MARKTKKFKTQRYWCVKQIHIFRDLTAEDYRALEKITTFNNLKHEERICDEGVYLIKEGRIKITDHTSESESKKEENTNKNSDVDKIYETKEVLEPGEIFGAFHIADAYLNQDSIPMSFAETLTEVCIGCVTVRDFLFFIKRKPHLGLPLKRRKWSGVFEVWNKLNHNMPIGNKRERNLNYNTHNILKTSSVSDIKESNPLGNIAFRCASSRMALLLHNIALVPDSRGIIAVPYMSKKQIAKLIGSSTETVVSLFNIFKQHDVIDTRRGKIQILNPWKLKKIADARMKTLLLDKESEIKTDQEIDFQTLTGFDNVNDNQINTSVSST